METPDPFFHRCGQFETEHFFRIYGRAYRKHIQRTKKGIRATAAGAAFRHRCGQDTHRAAATPLYGGNPGRQREELSVLGQAGIPGTAGKDISAAAQGTAFLAGAYGGILERQVARMEQRKRVLQPQGGPFRPVKSGGPFLSDEAETFMCGYLQVGLAENDIVPRAVSPAAG